MKRVFACGAALLLLTASAHAGFSLPGLTGDSNGPFGDSGNTVIPYNYAGPDFIPGSITVSGTLDNTNGNSGTYASEARIAVTNPSGNTAGTGPITPTQTYTGPLAVGPTTNTGLAAFLPGTSVGAWSFETFESYDDTGLDQQWTDLNIEIGDYVDTMDGTQDGSLLLDDKVLGDTTGATDDWALSASYSPAGDHLYAIDHAGGDLLVDLMFDDSALDLDMFLFYLGGIIDASQGVVSPEHVEALGAPAGRYYVLIDGWAGSEGAYSVVYTPEPTGLLLLGLGGLALLRRR